MYGEGFNEALELKAKGIQKYYFNDYFLLMKHYEKKYEDLMESICRK